MIKRGIRQIRCNIFLLNFLINISYHIRELKFLIRGKRIFSQGKATVTNAIVQLIIDTNKLLNAE